MKLMKKHWKYLKYVVRHKAFVFYAGLKTGAPIWRLLIHDWSKLTPAEWGPYSNYFYGKPTGWSHGGRMTKAFDRAWLHHLHWNKHHWQYWLLRNDDGSAMPLRMPEKYVREMVADWFGAGRAITGKWEALDWYTKNRNKMILHSATRIQVEELLFNIQF